MDQIKIGEYIKKNRKEKKLTQQQLADILHTTNKAVSKWETGVNIPETSMLVPLSEALGVSVLDLLMGADVEKSDIQEKNDMGTGLSDFIHKQNSKYRIVSVLLLVMTIIVAGIFISRGVREQKYLKQFTVLERGDKFNVVQEKIPFESAFSEQYKKLTYITPLGNIIDISFFGDEGLLYIYEYNSTRTVMKRMIMSPLEGEYCLSYDNNVRIVFNNSEYEIYGSGNYYMDLIEMLGNREKATFDGTYINETIYSFPTIEKTMEFNLNSDLKDVIVVYLGEDSFRIKKENTYMEFLKNIDSTEIEQNG